MPVAGSEVGNGYITIKPTLDEGAVKNVEHQGGRAGSGFGGAFSVAAGNLIANAVSTIASAAAEQFKKAFANIMDYEQLAGGAQKIFDELDYSVIARDATNAFKELNMSANEYLSAINMAGAAFAQTMGDEKGYAVAREGMLAISDYATGTGRNIEELNQKYQMITRSASSYQSIADQFAGILPATSKDFLEQAQAAGYLSDEYTKLTDVPVAEYQEAVTKMLTKGVDDLGLAANTLHESTGTMSGSLAMLSSAWENFLTALGGGEGLDMTKATEDLINSLGAVAQNIIPALARIGQSIAVELPRIIGEALQNIAPMVREALVNAFGENAGNIFDGFIEMVENVKQTVTNAFELVASIIEAAMPFIQSVVLPVVETIASGIIASTTMIMQVINAVIDFLQANVVPVIQTVFDFIASTVGPVVQNIANVVASNLPAIQNAFNNATQTIGNVVQAVWPVVQNIITNVMNVIRNIVSTVAPVVQNIITTAFNGIRSIANAVWPVVQNIVSTAANVIKSAINGISSVVGGVQSTFNAIREAIRGPIETAKNIVRSAIDTISNIITGANLRLPDIRIPHFNIDGGEVPWGIGGKGYPPSISIDWYARGGIVDGATLIGAGEAGPEMILPKNGGIMTDFAEAVTDQVSTGDVVNEIRELRESLGYIIAVSAPTSTPRELRRINQKVAAYV